MIKKLSFLLFFFAFIYANAKPHKFYTSISQIEYNLKTNSYEITMNVFLDDWEKALSDAEHRSIRIDQVGIEKLSLAYLEKNFVFKYKEKNLKYNLIGLAPEKDILKIYIELPHKQLLKGLYVKNDCLISEFDGQINILNVLQKNERKTYIYKSINQFLEIK